MSQYDKHATQDTIIIRDIPNQFKSKGHFDAKRQQILNSFKQSENYQKLIQLTKDIVQQIVRKNPALLQENKGQIAALIGDSINKYVQSQVNYLMADPLVMNVKGQKIDVKGLGIEDVYHTFARQIKQSTICSPELKQEVQKTLLSLSEANKENVKKVPTV